MGCAASAIDAAHTHTRSASNGGGGGGGAQAVKHQTAMVGGISTQKQAGAQQHPSSARKVLVSSADAAISARSPVQSRSVQRMREARILHEPMDDSEGEQNEKSRGVRFPRIAGANSAHGHGAPHHAARNSDSDEQLLQLREHERAQIEAAAAEGGEAHTADSSPSKKSATVRRSSRGSAHRLPHLSPTVGSGSGHTPRGFFSATTRTHGLEDCGSDDGGLASGVTSGFGVPSSSGAHLGVDGSSRRGSNFTATLSAKSAAAFPSFATSASGENPQPTQPQYHRQTSKTNSKLSIEVRTPLQQHHEAVAAPVVINHHSVTTAPPIIGGSTTASAFSKRTPESKASTSISHKKALVHLLPQTSPEAAAAAAERDRERDRPSSTGEATKRPQLQVSIDSCDAAVPPAPSSRTAAGAVTAAAAAAATVAAATPQQSGGGDAIPIQDAESYARQYSMYSDASPQYREYKAAWEAEQARLKAERQALKGSSHLRSRSIYSPEPSDRSSGASPMLTGVVSPIPGAMSPTGEEGGFFVARGTALCMMFESSRPASVCASPVPNYALVRAPTAAPLSPSLYALGGGDKTMTDLARLGVGFNNAAPGSPNPLSPPISQRERLFYAPAGGGPEIVESSPTINAVGGGVPRHSRTQSNLVQAATTTSAPNVPVLPQRSGMPATGSFSHSHRRVASQPNDLPVPSAVMPAALQQLTQQAQQNGAVHIPPAAPREHATHTGVDWRRVESRLHRLAEETDAEAHTHRPEQSVAGASAGAAAVGAAPTSESAVAAVSAPLRTTPVPALTPHQISASSVRALQQSHRSMPSASGPVSVTVVRGDDTRREPTAASADVMRIQVS